MSLTVFFYARALTNTTFEKFAKNRKLHLEIPSLLHSDAKRLMFTYMKSKLYYKALNLNESEMNLTVFFFLRSCVTTTIFEKFAKNRKMRVLSLGLWHSKGKRLYFIRMHIDFLSNPPFSCEMTRKLIDVFFLLTYVTFLQFAKKTKELCMCGFFYWKVRKKSYNFVYKRLYIDQSKAEKIFSEKTFRYSIECRFHSAIEH